MLKGKQEYSHVVLIGSTSEIGIGIVNQLQLNSRANLTLIGKSRPADSLINTTTKNIQFHECNLEASGGLDLLISKIENLNHIDLAIVAVGLLPNENLELVPKSVERTFSVNATGVSVALSSLADVMSRQNRGDILHISSVATIRPRLRNFTYGASKASADFFALGLSHKFKKSGLKVKILRAGFVHTKMTSEFKPAPFAISVKEVARIATDGLKRNQQIIYAPRKLAYIMFFTRLIPRVIFNKLG